MVKTAERKKITFVEQLWFTSDLYQFDEMTGYFFYILFFATANKFGYYTGHWTWFYMICFQIDLILEIIPHTGHEFLKSTYWMNIDHRFEKRKCVLENAHFSNPKHFNEVCRSNYMQALEKSESAFRRCN